MHIKNKRVKIKTIQYKIATILDIFSYQVFAPEAKLLQLTPFNWKMELENFNPDLLFVESAWRGKGDLWSGKIRHLSHEIIQIIQYCNINNIPTVFWNKEDPYHLNDFIETATLFDFIFTTDIECIPIYQNHVSHQNIFLLPFACQPKIHNPIEKYERKNDFVFAGAYYTYYPERNMYFEEAIATLSKIANVDIYDRNYGKKTKAEVTFPSEYHQYIRGGLDYSEIDVAYLGYKYAINLNSMTTSPTMFSRRVFELMASNTLIISNYTVGVKSLLGDLCISTNNMKKLKESISELQKNTILEKKIRLAALRKVMLEHTAKIRLDEVLSKVFLNQDDIQIPYVLCIAYVKNDHELCSIQKTFFKQTYNNKKLLLLIDDEVNTKLVRDKKIVLLRELTVLNREEYLSNIDYIVGFSTSDYYGKNYLTDLLLTTQYTDAPIITKSGGYYYHRENGLTLDKQYQAYSFGDYAALRASIIHISMMSDIDLMELAKNIDLKEFMNEKVFIIDEFNYCKNATAMQLNTYEKLELNDLNNIDNGIKLTDKWVEKQLNMITHQQKYRKIYPTKSNRWEKISHKSRVILKKIMPSFLLKWKKGMV